MIRSNPSIEAILDKLSKSVTLTRLEYGILTSELLKDRTSCHIFKITPENIDVVLSRRSQVLQAILPDVLKAQTHLKIGDSLVVTLWNVWIPLAFQLVDTYQGNTLVQGILGGQGTGKTTMTLFLKLIFAHLGYACINLSLDDLYKTYVEREKIKTLDPQIQWRGVPSTHDIQLGMDTLNQLCGDRSSGSEDNETGWEVPRFDKSLYSGAGDRMLPEKIFTRPQIILFEGWFVGVRPVDPELIQKQVPESDRQFVLNMNVKLQDYLPLWQKLDGLWLLLPQDYRYSLKWRQEAEHKLTKGMSSQEIEQFVHYFWRALPPEIFITPLRSSKFVDLVIEINSDHEVTALKTPILNH